MERNVSRFISSLFVLAFLVFLVMTFDNVYTDIAPIKALALEAGCKVKECRARRAITRVDRSFDGQVVTIQTESGTPFTVTCQRAHFVYGERQCVVK
jgi:hypothetical protein